MSVLPRICIANPTIQILVASSNTTIGELIINFCNNTYENNVITFFWVLKNSIEILGKHIQLCAFDGLFLILLTVVFVLHCTLHLHTILSREIFHIWLNCLLKNCFWFVFAITRLKPFSIIIAKREWTLDTLTWKLWLKL